MITKRILPLLALFLANTVATTFAQQDNANVIEQLQAQSLQREVTGLQSTLKLDKTFSVKVLESLKGDVKKTAEKIAAQEANGSILLTGNLDTGLRQSMWEKVKELVPAEKQAELNMIIERSLKNQEMRDENAVNGILLLLDSRLCLSVKQIDQLREKYSKDWDSYNNKLVGNSLSGFEFGMHVIKSVPTEEIEELLTKQQFDAFEALEASIHPSNLMETNPLMAIQMEHPGCSEDWDSTRFKMVCQEIIELKIEEIKRLCTLSQEQEERLSIAGKGAIGYVVENWEKLVQQAQNDGNAAMNMELNSVAAEPLISQCMRQKSWQNTLAKVLDESQRKKINNREEVRKKMAKFQLLNDLVGTATGEQLNLQLTPEQHRALVKMLAEKIEIKHSADNIGLFLGMFQVEDESFQKILNDEQWKIFQPALEQQRKSLQQLEEQMGKLNPDD